MNVTYKFYPNYNDEIIMHNHVSFAVQVFL